MVHRESDGEPLNFLVAEGASVVLADISAKVVEVAEQLNTAFTVGDLTEPVNCKATVDKAIAEFGNIDGVVVAAGVVDSKHLIDTAEEEFSRVININVMAPFQIAKAALPHMRDSGRNPSFVFVGSKDAFDVVPRPTGLFRVESGFVAAVQDNRN